MGNQINLNSFFQKQESRHTERLLKDLKLVCHLSSSRTHSSITAPLLCAQSADRISTRGPSSPQDFISSISGSSPRLIAAMWPTLVTLGLLCASLLVNVYQRSAIHGLENLLQEAHPRRVARSVSYYSELSNDESVATQTYYFPLYTQLSSKSIEKLCKSRLEKEAETDVKTENETVSKAKKPPKINRKQERKEKTCKEIRSLGGKTLVGARLHRVGAAVRSGEKWLLTEFSTGYSVFEYRTNGTDDISISSSDPYKVHMLNDPFQGTDHTLIGNGRTFVYNMAASKSIQFANLYTKRLIRRPLNVSNDPLYHHSFSYVDIESDETAVWVIYRKPHEHHLTVSRFDPISLSEKARWSLTHIPIEKNITNSFVACGILHTISTVVSHGRSTNRIAAVFDFDAGSYIHQSAQKTWEWKGYGVPSNVQYDKHSQSLNVFDQGNIYSISLNTE
uniref:Olfactomedin-like domain-containing protein n=1 Tax=Steinernema glaseri TaxID=37863 RepID=A0A1I8AMA2_9BILA